MRVIDWRQSCSSLSVSFPFLSPIHHTEMSICVHRTGESSDRSIDHQEKHKQPQHQGAIRTTKKQTKKRRVCRCPIDVNSRRKTISMFCVSLHSSAVLNRLSTVGSRAKEYTQRAVAQRERSMSSSSSSLFGLSGHFPRFYHLIG